VRVKEYYPSWQVEYESELIRFGQMAWGRHLLACLNLCHDKTLLCVLPVMCVQVNALCDALLEALQQLPGVKLQSLPHLERQQQEQQQQEQQQQQQEHQQQRVVLDPWVELSGAAGWIGAQSKL
jgi:hypothetical protein